MLATDIQMCLAAWQGGAARRLFASGTEEPPGKELIQNDTVRQAWPRKKKPLLWGRGGVALILWCLSPHPHPMPHSDIISETLGEERFQTQRELFSLFKNLVG